MYEKVLETVDFLKKTTDFRPKLGIILGSGLGGLVDRIDNAIEFDYESIPNFPASTVAGHAGKLVFGTLNGIQVLAMKGRFHFYEGHEMRQVTYPVYVMRKFGIEKLIVSNAAGGINKTFNPGTLMLITDFINMMGQNPLIGPNDERFGPRFPDMSSPYSPEFRELAKIAAADAGIEHREGVYLGTTGPYYETAAEIRMMSVLGADAVGMSTVPETIVANYLGVEVLAISCITNMATGIAEKPHSHDAVMEIARKTGERFCDWVAEIVRRC